MSELVGWVSLAIYGPIYRAFPAMTRDRLASLHFWVANAGALLLNVGVYLVFAYEIDLVAMVGALLTGLSMLLFFVVYLRGSVASVSTMGSSLPCAHRSTQIQR